MRGDSSASTSSTTRILRRRDPQELAQLLDKYRPLLEDMAFQFGDKRLRSKQDDHDLVQETYVDALKGLPNLQAHSSRQLIGWLRVLLINKVRFLRRHYLGAIKRNAQREVPLEHLLHEVRSTIARGKHGLASSLAMQEQLDRVRRAIASLPDSLRTLIEWRYMEQLSYKEIAQRVDRSEDAVRMLIQRCLKSLKPLVSDDTPSTI